MLLEQTAALVFQRSWLESLLDSLVTLSSKSNRLPHVLVLVIYTHMIMNEPCFSIPQCIAVISMNEAFGVQIKSRDFQATNHIADDGIGSTC